VDRLSLPGAEAPHENSDRASAWSTMRTLIRGHERYIGGMAVTAVFSGVAEAGILAAIAQVAAMLFTGEESVHLSLGVLSLDPTIGGLLGLAAALAAARIGLQAVGAYLQAKLASDAQANLRNNLFAAFTRTSWGIQANDREGHLQEVLTSQAMQSTGGALQLASLLSSLITFVVLVISAMLLNVAAAAIVVVVAFAIFAMLRPLSSLGRRSSKDLSRAQMTFAGGVGEAVRMSEETHVFGVGEVQRAQVSRLIDASRRLLLRAQFIGRFVPVLFQSLIYLTVIAGLAALHATGGGNVASLGAVVLIMVRAGSYGQQVQGSYQAMLQSLPFIERLLRATSRYEAGRTTFSDRPLPAIERISVSDVSYSYKSDRPVLTEIEFETERGETIGIVGPSGAGKSTLVQLLLRLRDPDRGTYAINGVPAQRFAPADWHRQVAYVPQEPQLLHASVTDNIRYFREIDDEMVERAARLARIDEDIAQWSNGYETIIGPRADSISGGQRQRICLARALAAAPEMLVLDEPTSALDPRSERLIQESLGEVTRELTLFVVTHRMTMLAVCDRVLVLVDGRVDDFGNTHVLRQTNEYLSAA
jgi:ABC-type multidrug transport system fused ATPase/permease subunit